jgi:flagellar hook-associated protein 1 FlgK
MDVASQNISNADVEGYSRKRLNLSADYHRHPTYGQKGFGVEVNSIERMRNEVIDKQIREQSELIGYSDQINTALTHIENMIGEPGESGLQTYIDEFFNSWHNLANNPTDVSSRTLVKTHAQNLIDLFHNIGRELSDYQSSINDTIERKASRINKLANQIFTLNQEIAQVEISDQNANDSRDKRTVLLKELSELTSINTIENEHGQITVTVEGHVLVSPVNYRSIETHTETRTLPSGDTQKKIGLRFSDNKKPFSPSSGEMRGLLDARDEIIPGFRDKLDTIATTLVEKVNELHTNGYSLNGETGITFFDPDVSGALDIELSASIQQTVNNIAAAKAGNSAVAPTNTFAAGALDFGTPPLSLSKTNSLPPSGSDVARNIMQNSVAVETAGGTTLTEGTDYRIDYVNGTIQLLHNGYDGQALNVDFRYRTGGYQGPGDNKNALDIAMLRDTLTMSPDKLGEPQDTFIQYYSAMVGELGLKRNEVETTLETRKNMRSEYEKHQSSIAGVSIDEEMANIIKFQHIYQAAARTISVTNQMLDTLLRM